MNRARYLVATMCSLPGVSPRGLYAWLKRPESERAVFEFIEGWYNPHHRYSSLDYMSPINFKRQHARHKGGAQTPNVELSTEAG